MLSRGHRVRDYEIIAPLGSGGAPRLYLARKGGAGASTQLVVLQLVHLEHVASARMSSRIAHPNVVRVEEIGAAQGRCFLVMEFVHGVSLAELVQVLSERRQQMDSQLCVWIVAQLAEALHAVHEARSQHAASRFVVHSDVSAQRVLIGHTGHVKLIESGIATSRLAPAPTERRGDVYALGVLLRELLTRSPSPGSEALDRLVRRALEPNSGARFGSVLEFRAALLRAAPEVLHVDASRLGRFLHALLGDQLKRQRESWPLDVSVQLELDATVDPLDAGEATVKFILEARDEEVTRVDEHPSVPAPDYAPVTFAAIDEDSNTEVAKVRPSIEAQIVTVTSRASSAPPRRMRQHSLQSRGAGLLSLGVLCVALGLVLGAQLRSEPAGTIRRLGSSAAFREPPTQLTTAQPEAGLPTRHATAAKRGLVLATRDAGLDQAGVRRASKHGASRQAALKQSVRARPHSRRDKR